ncbi:MAG TPA: hypothetical protein VGR26_08305 [Acidimicrobiales bacterium]|nr:hypothetical protein [Acidimicrobiales bacterium]
MIRRRRRDGLVPRQLGVRHFDGLSPVAVPHQDVVDALVDLVDRLQRRQRVLRAQGHALARCSGCHPCIGHHLRERLNQRGAGPGVEIGT